MATRPRILGLDLDPQTRCAHYHGATDVLAIRMHCCREYYACRECHDSLTDHPASTWPASANDSMALLCGACGAEQSIASYLARGEHCPACRAAFNPGCRSHHHLYFAPRD
ncbi:MAG TPA: CHY zinc finger protein [Gemmatimonadales bacterium]